MLETYSNKRARLFAELDVARKALNAVRATNTQTNAQQSGLERELASSHARLLLCQQKATLYQAKFQALSSEAEADGYVLFCARWFLVYIPEYMGLRH